MTTFKLTLSAALAASLLVTPEARAANDLTTPTAFTKMMAMFDIDEEKADRYWRLYGFIADGSMARPEAFENYGAPVEPEVRMEVDLTLVDPPLQPTPQLNDEPVHADTAIMVEPSILAACGMSQPTAYFAFDSAKVSSGFDPMLRILVDCMSDYPLDDARLNITGHADPRGPEEYNRELGLERANAVARELGSYGFDLERVDTYSWGESQAPEDPEQWDEARRVVIRLDR